MYRNLSEFIARLEREGELQRVSVPGVIITYRICLTQAFYGLDLGITYTATQQITSHTLSAFL